MDTAPMQQSLITRVLIAKGLRAFGDGFVSLLLPVYLLELGFGALQVGIIATATLCGSGLLTLGVGLRAHRYHYRTLLLAATALMTATGGPPRTSSLRRNSLPYWGATPSTPKNPADTRCWRTYSRCPGATKLAPPPPE